MKLKAVFTDPAALDANLAYMKSGLDNVGLTEHLAALGPLANDAPRYLFAASAFIEFFGTATRSLDPPRAGLGASP